MDILIVEDDPVLGQAVLETIELHGFSAVLVDNALTALDRLDKELPALLLSDVRMDEMDGQTLLKKVKRQYPGLPVVIMTAYASIDQAVAIMQDGAADYLEKPFKAEHLIAKIKKYLQPAKASGQLLVASDMITKKLFATACKVAQSEVAVLITGPSGSGKEIIARYIHEHSPRAKNDFIAINCAAIPESMLESILFGFEKGAFTGAIKTSPGKFEQAQGGTLLLDEITEMPFALQSKLLRVIQEKEVERLGGRHPIALDVRLIATTNRCPATEVKEGRFREDLYYRLNVFQLHSPALNDRKDDIIPLAEDFIRQYQNSKQNISLSNQARKLLIQYDWPGNVRELENAIQRALVLCDGIEIDVEDLQIEMMPAGSGTEKNELQSNEFKLIAKTLEQHEGHRSKTAAFLGISERALRYKLAKMREEGYLL